MCKWYLLQCMYSHKQIKIYIFIFTKLFLTDINGISQVDWDFLEVIYKRKDESPHLISDVERKDFTFDPEKYNDAVVMPWYRNQDQPQVMSLHYNVKQLLLF